MKITSAITRRLLLLSSTIAILPAIAVAAKPLGLGDEGYEHEYLHQFYQQFFNGKCPCAIGECRPTLIRVAPAVPDTAMEVLLDGNWYPVPKNALQLRTNIPPELLEYPAHVCAHPYYVEGAYLPNIECVVFNGTS